MKVRDWCRVGALIAFSDEELYYLRDATWNGEIRLAEKGHKAAAEEAKKIRVELNELIAKMEEPAAEADDSTEN